MIIGENGFTGSALDGDRTVPEGGTQREMWRDFYQVQWSARRRFLDDRMAAGETSVMRLIGLLDKFERKFLFDQVRRYGSDGSCTVDVTVVPRRFEGELTPAGVPPFRQSSLRGQMMSVPFHTPDAYVPFLADVIDAIGPVDAVLELGCGYGRNLFSLFHAGTPGGIPYFGGELSTDAQGLGNALAALCPEARVSLHPFDHLSPDLSFLPRVGHLFAFTVHSLEQVQDIGPAFFRTLAAAAERVTVVHLEPFGHQAQVLGPATARQKEHFTQARWNRNLWPMLERMQQDGVLRLDFAALELFLPADAGNPTSVALWRTG